MPVPPMPTVPVGPTVVPTEKKAHPSAIHPKVFPATFICPADVNF